MLAGGVVWRRAMGLACVGLACVGRHGAVWRWLLGVLVAAAVLAGCDRAAPKTSAVGGAGAGAMVIKVVATTAHMGELVRHVAGERLNASSGVRVELRVLMGEGVDPHGYKLTRSDAALLDGAGMVLASGLRLEGKLGGAIAELRASGKRVLLVGDELPREKVMLVGPDNGPGGGHSSGVVAGEELEADPHFWMDPELFALAAERVGAWLGEADGANAAAYAANARAYAAEVMTLDVYARGVLSSVPEGRRVLVTSHDAFGYLSRRYGLTVKSVQGLSTESEAGVRDVQGLVELIAGRGVPAVFVESSVSPRTIEAVVAGVRARGGEVRVGGSLFSDALGAPGTYEGTYVGMMDHNVTTIARALGGSAPARGMAGKLAGGAGPAGGGGR